MLARRLEREGAGVRFCPDEWMAELRIDLDDRSARERIDQLQWQLAQLPTGAGCDRDY